MLLRGDCEYAHCRVGEFERGTRVRGEMGEGGQFVSVKREVAESSAKEPTGGRELERRSGGAAWWREVEKEGGRVLNGCTVGVFVDFERMCFEGRERLVVLVGDGKVESLKKGDWWACDDESGAKAVIGTDVGGGVVVEGVVGVVGVVGIVVGVVGVVGIVDIIVVVAGGEDGRSTGEDVEEVDGEEVEEEEE